MKPEQKKYILENRGRKTTKQLAADLGLRERKVRKFLEKQPAKPAGASQGYDARTPPLQQNSFFWFAIGLIVLVGFLIYANVLKGQFLLDDEYIIQHNLFIRTWQNLGKIFSSSILQGSDRPSSFYRPLQIISYTLDYAFWKFNVVGYHLTNVFLHIATALLIFWFLNILFHSVFLSFIASLFFVIHPIHTEAVSYISGRADSLATVFIFLALIFYLKLLQNYSLLNLLIMLASYILALLSRESALILPLLVLVYHFVFRRKLEGKFFGLLLSVAGIYVFFRFTLLRFLLEVTPSKSALLERLPGFFLGLVEYLKLLVWPFRLHMEYGTKLFPFAHPQVFIGLLIFLLLIIAGFIQRKRWPLFSFAVLWFFVALVPFSNLYPLNAYMAEHWLYLPSLGFFLILGAGLDILYKRKSTSNLSFVLAACLAVFFSILTVRQNGYWNNPLSFYQRTLKFAPDSSISYCNLGRIYEKAGRRQEAIEAFKKAIEVDPVQPNAYSNLAVIYSDMGQKQEAIANFEKAVKYSPQDSMLWNNLGAAYSEVGNWEQAITALKKAIELNPHVVGSYYNLALIYNRLGRKHEADELLKKIQEINPDFQPQRVLGRIPD